MRVLLIRPTADFGTDIKFSGGDHVFTSIAKTLANDNDVHVLYCASKAQLLVTAMQHGCMPRLGYSQAVEGVAFWHHNNITHHIGLTDAEQSAQDELSNALASMGTAAASTAGANVPVPIQRLLNEAKTLTNSIQQHQLQCYVLLDADSSQNPLLPNGPSLLEAVLHSFNPKHVVLLVQNIHFLPLGPHGSAPRSPGVLAAWGTVGGAVCVSNFVAQYVAQHAVPLGLQQRSIRVAHCATWGAFGSGPFQDIGAAHAAHLPWHAPGVRVSSSSSSSSTSRCCSGDEFTASKLQQQQQQQRKPIVGCLKLTPEKGGHIFLSLAQKMPDLTFLAVCADPGLQQAAAALALPNLRLTPPTANVEQLLQHVTVVLAPSVWQEAFGMVVLDAQLRGIPVIVSDQGALAEAAQGAAAAVVPVNPMVLPCDDAASPSWQARVFPHQQPLDMWASAIRQLMSSRERYEAVSRAGREAALRMIQRQKLLEQQFVNWLGSLE